jgi:hypothetical protein
MPLLDRPAGGAATNPTGAEAPVEARSSNKEDVKKANEKKLKERRKQEKVAICKYLRTLGTLPSEIEAIVHDWENPRQGGGGAFGEPLFFKIFGQAPKVGDTVTLNDVVNRTLKGVDKMNELMRKWREGGGGAKTGTVVEFAYNASAPLQSVYTIKAIG